MSIPAHALPALLGPTLTPTLTLALTPTPTPALALTLADPNTGLTRSQLYNVSLLALTLILTLDPTLILTLTSVLL